MPSFSEYFETPVAISVEEFSKDVLKYFEWVTVHPLAITSGEDNVIVICDSAQVAELAAATVRSVGVLALERLNATRAAPSGEQG